MRRAVLEAIANLEEPRDSVEVVMLDVLETPQEGDGDLNHPSEEAQSALPPGSSSAHPPASLTPIPLPAPPPKSPPAQAERGEQEASTPAWSPLPPREPRKAKQKTGDRSRERAAQLEQQSAPPAQPTQSGDLGTALLADAAPQKSHEELAEAARKAESSPVAAVAVVTGQPPEANVSETSPGSATPVTALSPGLAPVPPPRGVPPVFPVQCTQAGNWRRDSNTHRGPGPRNIRATTTTCTNRPCMCQARPYGPMPRRRWKHRSPRGPGGSESG